jgi:hypothetical protein
MVDLPDWVVPYAVAQPPLPPRHVSASQPDAVPHLIRTIAAVVEVESPVHLEVVDQRIRDTWQIGRIGATIRAHVETALRRGGFTRDGDFLTDIDLTQALPTRTHDTDSKRDIRHIHPREIEDTSFHIARDAKAIGRDELVLLTARYLGFARAGADVRQAVNEALDRLQESGWLVGEDDRIQAV